MKEEILSIASDLREGHISSNQAKHLLLVLFDVSERSKKLCSCSSKILSNGNIQFSLCRKCQEEMNEHI